MKPEAVITYKVTAVFIILPLTSVRMFNSEAIEEELLAQIYSYFIADDTSTKALFMYCLQSRRKKLFKFFWFRCTKSFLYFKCIIYNTSLLVIYCISVVAYL